MIRKVKKAEIPASPHAWLLTDSTRQRLSEAQSEKFKSYWGKPYLHPYTCPSCGAEYSYVQLGGQDPNWRCPCGHEKVTCKSKRELNAPAHRKGGIPRFAGALARGEITRDQYVRETARDYDFLARRLEHFWELPRSIEHADIVQQLYLATFEHAPRWDPKRAPIGRYLVFNSMADTKKWLNGQRGARKGSDPSTFELLVDDVFVDDEGKPLQDVGEKVPVDAVQDALPLVRELFAQAEEGDAECLLALLFEDDERDAVHTVFEDGVAATEHEARRMVKRAKERARVVLAD